MADSYWERITTQRVSRRRVLQTTGLAGAAASAVWLVGCGSGGGTKTPTGGTPSTGKTAEPTTASGVANPGTAPKSGGT